MIRVTRGRRRTSVFVGAALLVLAFGVSVGLAKSGPSQVKTSMYKDPTAACPVNTSGKVYGTATLIREKDVITVRVHLRGAVPGKYFVQLGHFDGIGCVLASPSVITLFNVDSSGDGQGSGTFVGMQGQTFAVGAFNPDALAGYVSPLVKIGS